MPMNNLLRLIIKPRTPRREKPKVRKQPVHPAWEEVIGAPFLRR